MDENLWEKEDLSMAISPFGSLTSNLTSLQVANQLATNQTNLSNTILQLSTGLRINTPANDVAGNAIANNLQNGINVLNQGSLNAQDAVSVVQVAQGGLTQIMNILQQMNSLAAEAASAAKSSTDRQDIQQEINQLQKQINQIVGSTTFGTQPLLDGSIQAPQAGIASTINLNSNAFLGGVGVSFIAGFTATAAQLAPASNYGCFLDEVFQFSIAPDSVNASSFIVNVYSSVQGQATLADICILSTILSVGSSVAIAITAGTLVELSNGATVTAGGGTFNVTLNFSGLTYSDIANMVGSSAFMSTTAYQPGVTVDKSLMVQVGPNAGNVIRVYSPSMQASSLFSQQNINVTDVMQAEGAINQIQHAISIVSSEESVLGAAQNRFNDLVQ
ncbi:MAG: hypothetical protein M1421_01855, partial [Candidatus Eremiobacteraeota bacterium]|nr:hypothetical protein [Candidatus Eremiobacteraeota bacterium]